MKEIKFPKEFMTFVEVSNFLQKNNISELRVYANVLGRKKERGRMFDDGERTYSVDKTEFTPIIRGFPLTKIIFANNGFAVPSVTVIQDEFVD